MCEYNNQQLRFQQKILPPLSMHVSLSLSNSSIANLHTDLIPQFQLHKIPTSRYACNRKSPLSICMYLSLKFINRKSSYRYHPPIPTSQIPNSESLNTNSNSTRRRSFRGSFNFFETIEVQPCMSISHSRLHLPVVVQSENPPSLYMYVSVPSISSKLQKFSPARPSVILDCNTQTHNSNLVCGFCLDLCCL